MSCWRVCRLQTSYVVASSQRTAPLTARGIRSFVDLSSTGAVATTEIAAALAPRGIEFLDAPVSGGVAGARAGKLTVMVSGPRATYDELQPLLAVFGRVLFVAPNPASHRP